MCLLIKVGFSRVQAFDSYLVEWRGQIVKGRVLHGQAILSLIDGVLGVDGGELQL